MSENSGNIRGLRQLATLNQKANIAQDGPEAGVVTSSNFNKAVLDEVAGSPVPTQRPQPAKERKKDVPYEQGSYRWTKEEWEEWTTYADAARHTRQEFVNKAVLYCARKGITFPVNGVLPEDK